MKEILKTLVETMTLPEDSYLEQDAEILEIFIEELDEIFVELDPLLVQWIEQPNLQNVLTDIRRHFHTLKGSGRMVGAKSSGELGWTVEDTLNRVLAGTIPLTTEIQRYVQAIFNIYRFKLIHDFKAVRAHLIDLRPLVLLGQQLQQQSVEPALSDLLMLADHLVSEDISTGLELVEEALFVDHLTQTEQLALDNADIVLAEDELLAKETLAIFLEEAEEHLATIDQFLQNDHPTNEHYNHLIRALHTLRGSSAMAHIDQIFDASSKVENLFKTLLHDELDSNSNETALLTHYAQFVRDYLYSLRQLETAQRTDEIHATFNTAWDSYDFQLEDSHGENLRPQGLVSQLLELHIQDLLDVESDFDQRARTEFPQYIQQLSQQAEILLQHTHHHATIGMYQYTSLLRSSYQDLIYKPSLLNLEYGFELYDQVHQQFIQLFDTLAAGQRVTLTKEHEQMLNELSTFTQQNIELLEAELIETNLDQAAPLSEAEVVQDSIVDTSDLAARFALDKQQLSTSESNRDFDPDLLDIFLEEADELLVGIDEDLNTWVADLQNVNALKNLMRYLHTLKGGSNMIHARHIGLIAHELETIYEKLINQQIQATPSLISVIRSVQDDIADRIQTIRDQQVDYPSTHVLDVLTNLMKSTATTAIQIDKFVVSEDEDIEKAVDLDGTTEIEISTHSDVAEPSIDVTNFAAQLALDKQQLQSEQSNRDFDPDLLDIFLEEADELMVGIDADLNTWTTDRHNVNALKNLMRYLHTLKGGSNMIQARHIGLIAHELETIYEKLINQQIQASPQLVAIIRLVQDDIADRIQTIRDQQTDYPSTHVIQLLQHADQDIDVEHYATETEIEQTSAELVNADLEVVAASIDNVESESISAETQLDFVETESLLQIVEADSDKDDVTSSLMQDVVEDDTEEDDVRSLVEQTFLEEAEELLGQAQHLLEQWFEQRGNRSLLLQLQRNAHSLKGGARMAEMDAIAIIAYHLENAFEQFGLHHFSSNVYDNLLNTALAWLNDAIFKRQYANFDGLKQSLENMEFVDVAAQLPQKLSARDIFTPEYTMEFVQGDGTEPPSMLGEWESTERIEQNNEMIRVSAEVIEKMIDLSGENAINRSRIEMDLGQLGGTLTEMELAIKRLADQLRRMEGELESQIIARHGGEDARYADFDPLEMDQYSSLNQLSKSLAESASDLVDFKTTLSEKIRDTEGLLLQQSRIQAEIQESLMRTRLVPFSRLLPRLQRIVRQTASTLNRPTELVVNNTEGELDRSILERLVAPFEHMLRNAIDHGIEDREQRLQAKKPETGHIVLNIGRQGTDVVVTFSDDGKGIDVNRIKEKAIQTGLMTKDQKLDQDEILQFIFHPGFSTAAQVTQISGRGVGLDVVQSDIKALGGHVSVGSILGKGTTFTIRVPTTVAVSDALMVKAGDQQFAFPLAQIDRIVRISPMALEQYFESQDDYFKIDQEDYRLRYLSEFVAGQPIPRLTGIVHSLPVLLIKGAQGQMTALLVDQLIGSRGQIVVKPVGQQFSSIGVIAGATILGDGQVCLILDGQNLARQAQSTARSKQADETYTKQRYDERRLIMIVDDSVTVRKVTSRLLERQGYDVVTAKDGVDAMEQLETVKPDLMLLDIEMPRMDGFEVTNLVRYHEIHRDLPIIMITSRTGEKHRERALSLGVSQYMGKPFQEETLLENIESLLAVR